MSPRKTTNKKQHESAPKAPVINLSDFRETCDSIAGTQTSGHSANLRARHALIGSHLASRIEVVAPTAVAVALVLLRADGTIDTSATGVEPEYVQFLTRGLDSLSSSLKNQKQQRRRDPSQSGFAALPALSALAFMAATYINDYAWLDALLSLSAQFVAAKLWNKHS